MHKKIVGITLGAMLVSAFAVSGGLPGRALADNGNEQGGAGIGATVSTLAHAIQGNQDNGGSDSGNNMQASASIAANGNFSITGASVASVDASANTITGTLYGITKTINVSGATLTGGSQSITLGNIQAGDLITVKGSYDGATHTVTIASVNDVSYATQNNANIQSRINQLLQMVKQLQAQLQAQQGSSSSSVSVSSSDN